MVLLVVPSLAGSPSGPTPFWKVTYMEFPRRVTSSGFDSVPTAAKALTVYPAGAFGSACTAAEAGIAVAASAATVIAAPTATAALSSLGV